MFGPLFPRGTPAHKSRAYLACTFVQHNISTTDVSSDGTWDFFVGLFSDALRGRNMECSYLIYLFDLCNDAVGSSDYVGPSSGVFNEW